jgi:flagellar protein FliO/FliZ
MAQTYSLVIAFLLVLIALALGAHWLQRRGLTGAAGGAVGSRVVSVLAVGPHQKVMTVEVDSSGQKIWLILGVTPQSISCLHSISAAAPGPAAPAALVVS